MLAYALVFVAIVASCVGALLEGGIAFARVSARHAAEAYAEVGLTQARSALLTGIAQQVRDGTLPLQAPSPMPVTQAGDYTVAATFAVASAGAPNVESTELQSHPAIAEGRVAAAITLTVASPLAPASVLAQRTQYLTLRTFAVPPYAALDGATDAAGARDAAAEGDSGGCDPTLLATCDANLASAPGATPAPVASMDPRDTRIHALELCVDGGTGACAGRTYVSIDPAPTSSPWFNANANGDGWSR